MLEIIIQKFSEQELEKQGVRQWPIWTKEISRFDWKYEEQEMCLFLEGEAEIETPETTVRIVAGDFVIFPKGLSCVWNILSPVRKHYNFA